MEALKMAAEGKTCASFRIPLGCARRAQRRDRLRFFAPAEVDDFAARPCIA
jgi:hypothetical protein